MRTIPDAVLDAIARHRPHLATMIANLRNHPERADQLERDLANAYLMGETRLSGLETLYLAACAAGHPYGRYIDLTYAAHLSGLSESHLRRRCIAGEVVAVKRRGQWYADREALPQRQRQPKEARP